MAMPRTESISTKFDKGDPVIYNGRPYIVKECRDGKVTITRQGRPGEFTGSFIISAQSPLLTLDQDRRIMDL